MKKYKDGDTRTRYEDESFHTTLDIELKDGTLLGISCRKHFLSEIYEYYSENDDIWYKEDGDEIEHFYLTSDEKRFTDEDVCQYFGLDEDYWVQGDNSNGWSDDYCGINETDDHEKSLEKFKNYKLKFDKVTSKDQFDIEK